MNCDNCIYIGDMGGCQNFKGTKFGEPVRGEEACQLIEIKGEE